VPQARLRDVTIEYDTFGDVSHPALLLIMGLGTQMIAWDDEFCELLAARGHFVIRFDNRDCGLSTHLDGLEADLAGTVTWLLDVDAPRPRGPYLLRDMADDAAGLLDHLRIERAHIVGASMGGMIAQTMAIELPERVVTLTSIMSNTGEREFGGPAPEALPVLLTPAPHERDAFIEHSAKNWRILAPHRHFDEQRQRARAAAAYDRAFYPEGVGRQLVAIMASGDRAEGLAQLSLPTLVLHGRVDTLVDPSGGERTAELVPGAHLVVLGDMGHDLPPQLWPFLVDVIAAHTVGLTIEAIGSTSEGARHEP
jgi:pimeloyl-ACP methyl ester carboxylesterase